MDQLTSDIKVSQDKQFHLNEQLEEMKQELEVKS